MASRLHSASDAGLGYSCYWVIGHYWLVHLTAVKCQYANISILGLLKLSGFAPIKVRLTEDWLMRLSCSTKQVRDILDSSL